MRAGPAHRIEAILFGPGAIIGALAGVIILLAVALSSRVAGGSDLLHAVGLVLIAVLAYINGANSVSESVATLVAGGVTGYRPALLWGAAWSLAGSLAAAVLASALVTTFASGFLGSRAHLSAVFVLAVLIGAIVWMMLATATALPVASTHALAGALVIVGALAFGLSAVHWGTLLEKAVLPLLVSPFVAVALALAVYLVLRVTVARCSLRVLGVAHWISSAAASFVRGLNEGPKIVALGSLLLISASHRATSAAPFWLFALVGLAIAMGSFFSGEKVTRTLAEKVTNMDHAEAFSANLVTALVVGLASNRGLPVSNAEVGSGAISGVGLRKGMSTINWSIVRNMALAWVVTTPAAGIVGLAAYVLLALVHGSR